MRLGGSIPAAVVERATAAASADEESLNRIFDGGVDAVLTPMFTRRPPAVGEYEGRRALYAFVGSVRFVPYCGAFNHTGQPAASIPATWTAGRLPGRRAARRPARRRARAAGAGRAARDRARMARPQAPAGVMSPAGLREIAEAVAREAGHQLREAFAGPRVNVTAKSSPTDLVSEADHAAERLIRERLAAARPGRRLPRRGGRRRDGDHEPALGRRPARRHDQLPLRHPAVGGQHRVRGRRRHAGGRDLRPDARRAVVGRARRPGAARRPADQGVDPRRPGHRVGVDGLRLRRGGAPLPGRRSPPACSRSCATSGASARRRSTSRGRPPAATTRSTSAASTAGTARRASCCACAPASPCASSSPLRRRPAACSSPHAGLIDALEPLVA